MRPQIGNFSTAIVLMTSAVMAACGGSSANSAAGPGGRGGSPPAAGVTIVTLQPKPIEQTSDFIATVRSLHSTTIQPQVEGHVTKIFVKSGDQVRAGAPLLQIDPERQAATVRSSQATRQAREADVTYWTGQVERLKSLLNAGAISKNEFDQAQHELEAAQANLGSLNAQVRENQVQLQYYRVIAPTSGTVGDLPIREGDRVTTSTMITTIDDRSALEAYIQIPLDRAPELRVGLPVQFLDKQDRVLVTNGITYVAPRVDDATQTILAKVLVRNVPPSTRVQQYVKARIVWRSEPGLTVPLVSVLRIGGQYFSYVAEPAGEGLVAKQRPVQLGEIVGNDYVVIGGLKAGDKVIVSGVQKIGDGMPVKSQ